MTLIRRRRGGRGCGFSHCDAEDEDEAREAKTQERDCSRKRSKREREDDTCCRSGKGLKEEEKKKKPPPENRGQLAVVGNLGAVEFLDPCLLLSNVNLPVGAGPCAPELSPAGSVLPLN